MDPRDDGEEVGTLGEEAAKLLGVLAGWADPPPDGAVQDATPAGGGAAGAHATCEHGWCPLCRGAEVIRSVSPEVREQLAVAASSLVQAAAGLLAAFVPPEHPAPPADPDHHTPDEEEHP